MTEIPTQPCNETFIGDGLFVSHDAGNMIKLRAPRYGEDHLVYLEPVVFARLLRWIKESGEAETFASILANSVSKI